MSDGRLPRGPLHAAFRTSLGLTADLDVCAEVMHAHTRGRIAAMSRLVTRAAQDGDIVALRILDDAARELAAVADAVRHALEFEPDEGVPVSWSGGVFNAGELILRPLQRHLEVKSRNYQLNAPLVGPGIGAAVYAAKLAGEPLSVAAMARLRSAGPSADREL
jgi:N-acetylglucosamine kinase-like BadF-type ATPase